MRNCNYYCVNCTCNDDQRRFIIENDEPYEQTCPNDSDVQLKLLGFKDFISVDLNKTKKGRSTKERNNRRITDFRKNILPNTKMDKWERDHFVKKYGKPL